MLLDILDLLKDFAVLNSAAGCKGCQWIFSIPSSFRIWSLHSYWYFVVRDKTIIIKNKWNACSTFTEDDRWHFISSATIRSSINSWSKILTTAAATAIFVIAKSAKIRFFTFDTITRTNRRADYDATMCYCIKFKRPFISRVPTLKLL